MSAATTSAQEAVHVPIRPNLAMPVRTTHRATRASVLAARDIIRSAYNVFLWVMAVYVRCQIGCRMRIAIL